MSSEETPGYASIEVSGSIADRAGGRLNLNSLSSAFHRGSGPDSRVEGIGKRASRFAPHVTEHAELSPTDWVREQTERILEQGTTDGVEILDRPIVLVTTTGAKSGKQRYVPLMRVEKDGRYLMVASKGGAPAHPSWYFNVKANPAVTLQDGDKVVALAARELDGDERDEWWRLAVDAYPPYAEYQTKTTRRIPVFVVE